MTTFIVLGIVGLAALGFLLKKHLARSADKVRKLNELRNISQRRVLEAPWNRPAFVPQEEDVSGVRWTYAIRDGKAVVLHSDAYVGDLVVPRRLGDCPVVEIGDMAFAECKDLRSLSFPDSISNIGNKVFQHCMRLEKVEIPQSNSYFSSNGRFILSKDGKQLIAALDAEEHVIPSGVEELCDFSFWCCSSVKRLTFPESLAVVGHFAFSHCTSLESITFPAGVRTFGIDAFSGCLALRSIGFMGRPPEGKVEGPFALASAGSGWILNAGLDEKKPVGILFPDEYASSWRQLVDGVRGVRVGSEDRQVKHGDYVWTYRILGRSAIVVGVTPAPIGDVEIPCTLEGAAVTEIGKEAFADQRQLVSIVVPSTVTTILHGAFARCTSLVSIVMPSSVSKIAGSAFSDCKSLRSIELPEGLDEIGYHAFYECKALKGVMIPKSVRVIGEGAFQGCASIERVDIPPSIREIASYTFAGCATLSTVTFPEGLRMIGHSAFYGCSCLRSVRLPEGLEKIREQAFWDAGLVSIRIPKSVKAIEHSAFAGFRGPLFQSIEVDQGNLAYSSKDNCLLNGEGTELIRASDSPVVCVPDGVVVVGPRAFMGFKSLREVGLPQSVCRVQAEAFRSCLSLESITLPERCRYVAHQAFDGCHSLKSVLLSDSLLEIFDRAFGDCCSLRTMRIPPFVKKISDSALCGCTSLEKIEVAADNRSYRIENGCLLSKADAVLLKVPATESVSIPDGVAKIDGRQFSGCKTLRRLHLPASVCEIDKAAFRDCSALLEISLDENNMHYKVERGVLRSKDGSVSFWTMQNEKDQLDRLKAIKYENGDLGFLGMYGDKGLEDRANINGNYCLKLPAGFFAEPKSCRYYGKYDLDFVDSYLYERQGYAEWVCVRHMTVPDGHLDEPIEAWVEMSHARDGMPRMGFAEMQHLPRVSVIHFDRIPLISRAFLRRHHADQMASYVGTLMVEESQFRILMVCLRRGKERWKIEYVFPATICESAQEGNSTVERLRLPQSGEMVKRDLSRMEIMKAACVFGYFRAYDSLKCAFCGRIVSDRDYLDVELEHMKVFEDLPLTGDAVIHVPCCGPCKENSLSAGVCMSALKRSEAICSAEALGGAIKKDWIDKHTKR